MILADNREPHYIISLLKREAEVFVRKLEVADYIVDVNGMRVAIERKEIGDYIASVIDGRLPRQAFHMSVRFSLSFVVIVGYISEALMERSFSRRAFYGSLIALSLKKANEGQKGAIIPLVVEANEDFATFIILLHKALERGKFNRLPYTRSKERGFKGVQVAMLTAIPGIGVEMAKTLLDGRTLQDLMKMDKDELMKIRGVGVRTASKILYYLRGVKDE